jgi:hypothetical protein
MSTAALQDAPNGWRQVSQTALGMDASAPHPGFIRPSPHVPPAPVPSTGISGPSPPPAANNPGDTGEGTDHGSEGASMRTVALGQDAGGIDAEAGLTHADFRAGELV